MVKNSKQRMIHLIPTGTNIDFLKISKPFVWASTVAIVLSIVGLFTVGLNLGIDFTGGAEVAIQAPADWNITQLRAALDEGGVKDPIVVQYGDASEHRFLAKIQADPEKLKEVSGKVEAALAAKLQPGQYQILKADVIGPQAGERLRSSAILSILYAALGILFYITMRFDLRFAPGIVRALALDVILVVGIWIVLQKEFNLMIVAALLTIAGYSCNDTIVIYDRIREYGKTHPNMPLDQVINKSINLNLGRTILTVLCTLFVVVSLWLLGGPVLADFSFAMLIGFAVSVISTLFLANPLVLYMEKRRQARQAKLHKGGATSKASRA